LSSMRVVVAIGDVVGSRESPDRMALQAALVAAVAAVNREARTRAPEALLSPYTVTLGDEVQCVYGDPAGAALDVIAFKGKMLPHQLRFCLGVGELTTKINQREAIGMDGPAFHVARDGIEELKRDRSTSLAVKAQPGIDVELEDCMLKLIDTSVEGWRAARFDIFRSTHRHVAVKDMARELGLSPVAVYKNLSDGRVALHLRAAEAVGRSLAERLRQPSPP
jgi:SatD family (SatD)